MTLCRVFSREHGRAAPAPAAAASGKDDIASMFDPTMQAGYASEPEPAKPIDPERA